MMDTAYVALVWRTIEAALPWVLGGALGFTIGYLRGRRRAPDE